MRIYLRANVFICTYLQILEIGIEIWEIFAQLSGMVALKMQRARIDTFAQIKTTIC